MILCVGRVCVLIGWLFCVVVWFGCGWRELFERVIFFEFLYIFELNMDVGWVWLCLLLLIFNLELWNGIVELREFSDVEDLFYWVIDLYYDFGLVVDGLLLSFLFFKKFEGMGV